MNLLTISNNIFTIESFLTQKECRDFITQAEEIGFKLADVDTGKGRSLLSVVRNNERVDIESENLACEWWDKLPIDQLPTIDSMRPIGLSPRFRFYKYSPGQKFNMHKDGRQDVNGNTTRLTLLVYLNEAYLGGSTRFRQDNIEIFAETGKALIFEHHLWHQGVKVEEGTKYVLRTDIVFK